MYKCIVYSNKYTVVCINLNLYAFIINLEGGVMHKMGAFLELTGEAKLCAVFYVQVHE